MKYEEKRAEIRAYLESNRFPNKRIPSERDLAERFSMNLGMVREVLRELETLGILQKRGRQGNFLNSSVLRTRARIDDNCSFLALIQDQGYSLTEQKRLRRDHLLHDKDACQFLGNYARSDLLCFEELYLADGNPAILSYYYCPKFLFGQVDWDAISNDTEKLKEQICSLYPNFDHSVIHLLPAVSSKTVSDKLQLSSSDAMILWKEAYYNRSDELEGVSFNYLHPEFMDLAFVRKRPASTDATIETDS